MKETQHMDNDFKYAIKSMSLVIIVLALIQLAISVIGVIIQMEHPSIEIVNLMDGFDFQLLLILVIIGILIFNFIRSRKVNEDGNTQRTRRIDESK